MVTMVLFWPCGTISRIISNCLYRRKSRDIITRENDSREATLSCPTTCILLHETFWIITIFHEIYLLGLNYWKKIVFGVLTLGCPCQFEGFWVFVQNRRISWILASWIAPIPSNLLGILFPLQDMLRYTRPFQKYRFSGCGVEFVTFEVCRSHKTCHFVDSAFPRLLERARLFYI